MENKPLHQTQKSPLDLSILKETWGRPIVSREQIHLFTGGTLSCKTIANLDAKGQGPEGRIKIRGRIAYLVDPLVRWLESRTTRLS